MGLDCDFDAFHGAYSAFNRLRQCVADACGGSFPPHSDTTKCPDRDSWYWDGDIYSRESHPGIYEFLCHSDCDGEITPEMCVKVADDLEKLVPVMDHYDDGKMNGGHLKQNGGVVACVKKFIAGCREAAEQNVPLGFH